MMPTAATTIAITLHQKRPVEIAAKMGDVFLGRWQVFPGCEVAFCRGCQSPLSSRYISRAIGSS